MTDVTIDGCDLNGRTIIPQDHRIVLLPTIPDRESVLDAGRSLLKGRSHTALVCHWPIIARIELERTIYYEPLIFLIVWSDFLDEPVILSKSLWTAYPRKTIARWFPNHERRLIRDGFYRFSSRPFSQ